LWGGCHEEDPDGYKELLVDMPPLYRKFWFAYMGGGFAPKAFGTLGAAASDGGLPLGFASGGWDSL